MIQKKGQLGLLIRDAIQNQELKSQQNNFSKKNSDSKDVKEEKYIRWFYELSNDDVSIAGGKGASLSEMYNNKFPVPPGFVITAQSFDVFLTKNIIKEKIKQIIASIELEDTEQLTRASQEIRQLLESKPMPDDMKDEILEAYRILSTEKINGVFTHEIINILKNSWEPDFVSVRSSATTEDLTTASFAGQQESFLNIKGEINLIEHVKKCFSSLYTPRAIYYRNRKGFGEDQALLAVVVQKMIDSEKSGVAFSKDPNSYTDNIIIEAVFGLGEGIVSGMIKPDYYVISKELEIMDVKISEKKSAIVRTSSGNNEIVKLNSVKANRQVMSNAEILDVANYTLRLEEHYKKPQDIEFALEGGKVYIIQSRPITTIKQSAEKKTISGTAILTGLGASPGIGVGTVKIIKTMDDLPKISKGDVLVTEMTNPDMVVAMQRSSAIVTDEGGITSHAAIVSREMGIPAVVGTIEATKKLKEGTKITVDGFNGKVYEGEVTEAKSVEIKRVLPTQRIKLKVLVDIPDYAFRASESGINEIGLLRLEGIIASSGKHPLYYEKINDMEKYTVLLVNGIKKIVQYFDKVWIRTSDIRTDEYSSLEESPKIEINPMLGFHGVRFSLKHPKILNAELEAIRQVSEIFPNKRFGVMFPQIISIEEVKECKKYFNEIKRDNMEFGVMIETPAAVQIIESISDEVQFVSFGTNDLTQFTLAVDRGEDNVQYLYNELHPSVLSQIKKVIDVCRRKRVETSICGQAGSNKEMVEFLFRKGINSISVNADSAYDISQLINIMEDEWKKRKEEFEKQKQERRNKIRDEKKQYQQQNRGNIQENKNNFYQNKNWKEKNKFKWKKWGKGGSVQLANSDDNRQRLNDEQGLDEQRQIVDKDNSLNNQNINTQNKILDNIKISAEKEDVNKLEENIGPIEPFNDLEHIEKKSEELKTDIEEEKLNELKEMHEIEDNIIVSGEREHKIIEETKNNQRTEHVDDNKEVHKESDDELIKDIDNVLLKTKDFEAEIIGEQGIFKKEDNNENDINSEKKKYKYDFL